MSIYEHYPKIKKISQLVAIIFKTGRQVFSIKVNPLKTVHFF